GMRAARIPSCSSISERSRSTTRIADFHEALIPLISEGSRPFPGQNLTSAPALEGAFPAASGLLSLLASAPSSLLDSGKCSPGQENRRPGPAPPGERSAACLPYRMVGRPKVTLRTEPHHGPHPF